jgi:hypothetical protein
MSPPEKCFAFSKARTVAESGHRVEAVILHNNQVGKDHIGKSKDMKVANGRFYEGLTVIMTMLCEVTKAKNSAIARLMFHCDCQPS